MRLNMKERILNMWEAIGGAGIVGFVSLVVYIITKGQNKKIEEAEAKVDGCMTIALCEERSGNIQKAIEDQAEAFKSFDIKQDKKFEKLFDKIDQIKGG